MISLALAVLTLAIFWSVKDCGFINLDDNRYVYENTSIQSGLNWNSIKYAFSFNLSNWHPMTWVSLLLDYQLFGLDPAGYHLVNLLFHVMNTVLLFLVLRRLTGELWPGAFVAALFAVHPLHVESVAWVAERKDVLSTFFWMLTLGAYSYYVERQSSRRYFFVVLFFILGLMSKPMLVTLPFVLLLLDYWPLKRFGEMKPDDTPGKQDRRSEKKTGSAIYPLIREKVPLFALAILSGIVTCIAQLKGGAVSSMEALSLGMRIGNALNSYVAYMWKMIWPDHLVILYPLSHSLAPWQVLSSVFVLSAVTLAVFVGIKRAPYLAAGWLWYLGTLIPVIGIVQVGVQARADRYTYVPLIGLFIIVAWGIPDLVKKFKYRRRFLCAAAALCIACLSVAAWKQVGYWNNNIALYDHALKVTDDNWLCHNNRGDAYSRLGNFSRAIQDFNRAIEIKPNYAEAYYNRGISHSRLGNFTQAISDYGRAIELKSSYAEAHVNRGAAYSVLGHYRQAVADFDRVIEMKPHYAEAYYNRGVAHYNLGNPRQAIDDYGKAVDNKADYGKAYGNRALLYLIQGDNVLGCRDAQKVCELGNCELLAAAKAKRLCR